MVSDAHSLYVSTVKFRALPTLDKTHRFTRDNRNILTAIRIKRVGGAEIDGRLLDVNQTGILVARHTGRASL